MIPGKGSLEMVGGGEERWWNKMEVLAAQRLDKFYKCEMAKKPSSLLSFLIKMLIWYNIRTLCSFRTWQKFGLGTFREDTKLPFVLITTSSFFVAKKVMSYYPFVYMNDVPSNVFDLLFYRSSLCPAVWTPAPNSQLLLQQQKTRLEWWVRGDRHLLRPDVGPWLHHQRGKVFWVMLQFFKNNLFVDQWTMF